MLLLTLLLLLATTATAQNYTKMSRDLASIVREQPTAARAKSFTGNNRRIMLLVQGEGEEIEQYCIRHQGDIHIANMPVGNIAQLSESPQVTRMEANRCTPRLTMDQAAPQVHADDAWAGMALPQAFDGSGVLVGSIDIAHQYDHPAFRSTKDARMRIVRAWDILDSPEGQPFNPYGIFPCGTLLTDTTAIVAKAYSRDCTLHYHGTHTASTAAGSGWGSPYVGIAPEADIYMVSTVVSDNAHLIQQEDFVDNDAFVALQFQNIFDYADSIGQPCVINFSISFSQSLTTQGALLNEYFSRMTGPGKIIVASAGNSGRLPNYMHLTAAQPRQGGQLIASGSCMATIRTKSPLTLRIWDTQAPGQARDIALDLTLRHLRDSIAAESGLRPYEDSLFCSSEILDSMKICVYPDYEEFNREYMAYDILISEGRTPLDGARYAIQIAGDGAEAEIFMQNAEVRPLSDATAQLPGAEYGGTVAIPASLPSVIAVGATAWRTQFPNMDGTILTVDRGRNGTRATFSSVGPTMQGLTKPDIAAPGVNIIAAINDRYGALEDVRPQISKAVALGGHEYYYKYDYGTSMSAPIVTGTIALWLQADPTLDKNRITQIFQKTATHTDPTLPYPNNEYGYGEINAYAGLLEILGLTSVPGLQATPLRGMAVRPTPDGSISITFPAPTEQPLPLRLYSPGGALIKAATIPPHSTSYTIPATRSGIIAVQVAHSGSTLVRVP